MRFPLIFIVGPTAVGKTAVSLELACRIGADILSCDSMLVYKEPRIITSKPAPEILREFRHYLIDVVSVEEEYNVYDFFKSAREVISRVFSEKPLIVVGGSGLYFNILLYGIFAGPGPDKSLRQKILSEAESFGDVNKYLYKKLKRVDPQVLETISFNDTRRMVRALEVYYLSGQRLSDKKKQRARGIRQEYPVKIFGLYKERNLLCRDINNRTKQMFRQGAVEEVEKLLQMKLSLTAKKIIGISQIKSYLEGRYSRTEALELMARDTRRYAKRQFTWFRKEKDLAWINTEGRPPDRIANEILERNNRDK